MCSLFCASKGRAAFLDGHGFDSNGAKNYIVMTVSFTTSSIDVMPS